MDTSKQRKINTTDLLVQDDDQKQSDKAALTMASLSIVLLVSVSLILTIFHILFS